jgi:hypothetical protein
MMASLGGVLGGDGDISRACSMTTESMDKGSMEEVMIFYAASAGKRFSVGKGPEAIECTVWYTRGFLANKSVRPETWGPNTLGGTSKSSKPMADLASVWVSGLW